MYCRGQNALQRDNAWCTVYYQWTLSTALQSLILNEDYIRRRSRRCTECSTSTTQRRNKFICRTSYEGVRYIGTPLHCNQERQATMMWPWLLWSCFPVAFMAEETPPAHSEHRWHRTRSHSWLLHRHCGTQRRCDYTHLSARRDITPNVQDAHVTAGRLVRHLR